MLRMRGEDMARLLEQWEIQPNGRGVADTRSRIDSIAQELGYGPTRQRLLLLLSSEIVTNAVVHGAAPIQVGVALTLTGTQVWVADASSDLPIVRSASLHDLGGRGLALVNRFASSWGTRLHPPGTAGGKTVWFEIDHPDPEELYGEETRALSTTTSSSRT